MADEIALPRLLAASAMPAPTMARIRAYSAAAAPDSSRMKDLSMFMCLTFRWFRPRPRKRHAKPENPGLLWLTSSPPKPNRSSPSVSSSFGTERVVLPLHTPHWRWRNFEQGSGLRRLFHRGFGFQTLLVAEQACHGQHIAAPAEADQPIPRLEIAFHRQRVPALGMADIVDRDVVMLTPEERNEGERLTKPQHVARGCLALARGHHPM